MFERVVTGGIGVTHTYAEYLCDTAADLEKIDVSEENASIGSKAVLLDTKEVYILDNGRKWVKLKVLSSGDGATSKLEAATTAEALKFIGLEG